MSNNGYTFIGELTSRFSSVAADYRMSKRSRFVKRRTGLPTGGGKGDYHVRDKRQYYEDIEKARDMDRNDVLAGQILDRVTINILQNGFSIDPKTGDAKLDEYIKDRWNEESCDPDLFDIAGEMCWHDIEYAAIRSMFRDGDCFVIGTEEGPFQFLEAHHVQTENDEDDIVLGISIDEYRRKQSIAVMLDVIDPMSIDKMDEMPIPFRNENGIRQVFHVYNPKRTTMTRGVTAFAPIFEISGMLDDINFAKLVQQQLVSCFAIFRKQAVGSEMPSVDSGYGSATTEQTTSGQTRQIEGIAPGMEIFGAPGEELQGFSPNIPNSEYFEQVRLIMSLMSTSFGVPFMVLLLDASQTNFSGWRGAIDEARKGFTYHQHNLIKRLHTPAYQWKLSQWMDDDPALKKAATNEKIKLFSHHWRPPAWTYIEPMKDATSDLLRMRNGLISPRRLHQERGRDHVEVVTETIEDNARAIEMAIARAKQLSKRTGEIIHYRELLSLPTPDGVSVSVVAGQDGGSQA